MKVYALIYQGVNPLFRLIFKSNALRRAVDPLVLAKEIDMRTVKRFTPNVLDRFHREGRGTGTLESYIPWHRVSRSDPSSLGRSHLLIWRDRQRELLSDGEWSGLNFSTMLPNVVDLLEQFPLRQEDSTLEHAKWDIRISEAIFPGTIALAKALVIKHPSLKELEEKRLWTATTDILLALRADNGQLNLLAVSCKPGTLDDLSKRAKDLLLLEKTYWAVRHVRWLLITPQEYEKSVGLTLRRIAPWGLAEPVQFNQLQLACEVACALMSCSATEVLRQLSVVLTGRDDDLSAAQHALWQAVWSGHLPVDLRRGYRLHTPLAHISKQRFSELNPLAMWRSAWI